MPKLQISLPDGIERTHNLHEAIITIGRIADNAIRIDDASISSRHAQLTMAGGDYHLKDLNSTNGTRLNGHLISDTILHDGDRVRFGKIETVYRTGTAAESLPLPAFAPVNVIPAASSRKPSDFANASPFGGRAKTKDAGSRAIMGLAILAMVAFAAALASILTLSPPQ